MTLQINALFIKIFQYSQEPGADVLQLYHQAEPLAGYSSRTAAGFTWFVAALTALAGVGAWRGLSSRLPLALAAGAVYLCACTAHAITYMDLMYYYVKIPFLFVFGALGLAALRGLGSGGGATPGRLSLDRVAGGVLLACCLTLTVALLV
jgi:hypothetical protein